MKFLYNPITYIATYVMIGIITFGHALNTIQTPYHGEKLFGAMFSMAFWPLYWSAEFWK